MHSVTIMQKTRLKTTCHKLLRATKRTEGIYTAEPTKAIELKK